MYEPSAPQLQERRPYLFLAENILAEGWPDRTEPLPVVIQALRLKGRGRLGRHLRGLFLDDVREGEAGLPPGIGELDWRSTAELSARSTDVVLDIDPVPDVALLRVAIDTLTRLGFT